MNEIFIKIEEASDEGYHYAVYDFDPEGGDDDCLDGGQCTGTLANALDMAYEAAKDLIR